MKRSIENILQERFGDPIGSYAGDAPVGVRGIEESKCPKCGMEDCDCDHAANEAETCNQCGFMKVEGSCGCTHLDEAEACHECGMMPLEGEGCGCTHEVSEAKKKKRSLG